jgi:hypothetical protein
MTFLVSAGAIGLIFDMVRRVRRVRYRAEIQAKLDAEAEQKATPAPKAAAPEAAAKAPAAKAAAPAAKKPVAKKPAAPAKPSRPAAPPKPKRD